MKKKRRTDCRTHTKERAFYSQETGTCDNVSYSKFRCFGVKKMGKLGDPERSGKPRAIEDRSGTRFCCSLRLVAQGTKTDNEHALIFPNRRKTFLAFPARDNSSFYGKCYITKNHVDSIFQTL